MPFLGSDDFSCFLRSATSVAAVPLCPELRLHLADDLDGLWWQQETRLGRNGLPPPFWGVAWPGGQGLARYVLDHPQVVRGRSVLDIGSGSGLCAIAAASAGASRVEAADIDPCSIEAIVANAALNGVQVSTLQSDVIGAASRWDVILAADLWYERFLAARVTTWLTHLARTGTTVLVGDCNRAFFPRASMDAVERYEMPVPKSQEHESIWATQVWKIARLGQ